MHIWEGERSLRIWVGKILTLLRVVCGMVMVRQRPMTLILVAASLHLPRRPRRTCSGTCCVVDEGVVSAMGIQDATISGSLQWAMIWLKSCRCCENGVGTTAMPFAVFRMVTSSKSSRAIEINFCATPVGQSGLSMA